MIEFVLVGAAFVVFKFISVGICGYLKIGYLRRQGLQPALIDHVLSNRKSGFDLDIMTASLPAQKLRIADAIGRKGMHLVFLLTSMIITPILALDYRGNVVAGIMVSVATLTAMVILYGQENRVSRYLFSPFARIMDGRQGRLNMLSAQSMGLAQSLLLGGLGYMGLFALGDERYAYAYMYVIYLPTAVGDTMGEVVGSIWGKHKIPVLGIGETNKKSIAGTSAVFLSSLISLLLVMLLLPTPPGFLSLVIAICVISTIVELYSPRSTDSFFIPVINVAVTVIWHFA